MCKIFFLKTLHIGKKTVDDALKKQQHRTFQGTDMRGKMPSANKTHEERVNGVCKHIESFPTVESHYTRKRSKRQDLNGDLSITKMYTMYKDKCVIEKKKPVTERYIETFFVKNTIITFISLKRTSVHFVRFIYST